MQEPHRISVSIRRLVGLTLLCGAVTCFCSCALGPWNSRPPIRREVFGLSLDGRPIEGSILGSGRNTLLLLGVTHGNEPAGKPLLEEFTEYLDANPGLHAGYRVVIVPVVNPDGLIKRSRYNARAVDLNRNFPSRNWTGSRRNGTSPGSEPETKTVLRLLRQFEPTRILSIHSPLDMVNYDGPARDLAEVIAKTCGYPVSDSVGYPTPGSLGSYAGVDWNIPTITLELGPKVRPNNAWPAFRETLLAFVQYEGKQAGGPRTVKARQR